MKIHNPDSITVPLGAYSHGIEVGPKARWLHISGQVGVLPDGSAAEGAEAQLECAWENIRAILASAGMAIEDIVKVTTYIVGAEDFAVHPRVRARHLGAHRATATAVQVSGLARPDLLIEIDVVAARED